MFTFPEPPAWAHAMISESWQDTVLNISFGRALGQSAAAQLASDNSTLVVRYVNAYNDSVKVSLDVQNWEPSSSKAPTVVQLAPPADSASVCGPACAPSYYVSSQASFGARLILAESDCDHRIRSCRRSRSVARIRRVSPS